MMRDKTLVEMASTLNDIYSVLDSIRAKLSRDLDEIKRLLRQMT